jgi:gas vesicle protein
MMNRKTEDGLALLAGAAIGTVAMFLLDPQSGARRRRQLAAVSREAIDITGETVGPVAGGLAAGASRLGRGVAETVGDYSSRFGSAMSEYGSRAADSGSRYLSDTGEAISEGSSSLWHRGKRMVGAEKEQSHFPTAPAAIGGAGLLALGAAAYWLFDARQGEARRHWLRDKTFSLLRDAGELARKTGRHVSNRAYGTYAETRTYVAGAEAVTDEQLVARVRSELGHVVSNMSNVSVTAHDGYVTLSGTIPQGEIRAAEASARAVRGVRDLNVQLQPHVAQPQ